jgi:hypothetical protein
LLEEVIKYLKRWKGHMMNVTEGSINNKPMRKRIKVDQGEAGKKILRLVQAMFPKPWRQELEDKTKIIGHTVMIRTASKFACKILGYTVNTKFHRNQVVSQKEYPDRRTDMNSPLYNYCYALFVKNTGRRHVCAFQRRFVFWNNFII